MHRVNLTGKIHEIEGFSGGCEMLTIRMEGVEVAATCGGGTLTTGKEGGDKKVVLATTPFLSTVDGGLGG